MHSQGLDFCSYLPLIEYGRSFHDTSTNSFKDLIRLCKKNGTECATTLLDHKTIPIDAYAVFLEMAITAFSKSNICKTCASGKTISASVGVAEESLALFIYENALDQWLWSARKEKMCNSVSVGTEHLTNSSRITGRCTNLQEGQSIDDESVEDTTKLYGPPYRFQAMNSHKKDGTATFGAISNEGLERYNAIVCEVMEARKGREKFEELILDHFSEALLNQTSYESLKRKLEENNVKQAQKVVVIDLYSEE